MKHLGVAPNSFGSFMKMKTPVDKHCLCVKQPGAVSARPPHGWRLLLLTAAVLRTGQPPVPEGLPLL